MMALTDLIDVEWGREQSMRLRSRKDMLKDKASVNILKELRWR